MQLSLSRMDVVSTDPAEPKLEKVQVLVRGTDVTVRLARDVLRARAEVLTVERGSRKLAAWDIHFADGTVWSLSRNPDCGCGGGRRRT